MNQILCRLIFTPHLAEIREESSELKALNNLLRDKLSAISLQIDELR